MPGGKPLVQKRAAKEKPKTIAECVTDYAKAKLSKIKSEKHRKQWSPSPERLAMPVPGQMQVQDIDTKDVLRMLEPDWRERILSAQKLRDHLEPRALRKGNGPSADGWEAVLKLVIARYADHCLMQLFRAYAASAVPDLYELLVSESHFYAIRQRPNHVL